MVYFLFCVSSGIALNLAERKFQKDKKNPAIAALIKFAKKPAHTAFTPSWAISLFRLGIMLPSPPRIIPIEEKFAKPHKAKVIIA